MKICRDLNISSGDIEEGLQTITGPELAELVGEEAFHAAVKNTTVFAKLTPKQKGDIVLSLKSQGNSVGMLGDGINDCIAVRFADVGISVDNGAVVAKSCADVILTDKKLSIIRDAIRTGRTTHGNAIKYIYLVVSANFGNALSILIASSWLPYQPMTSLQILVQNLLYDITQLALPWDRIDKEYMLKPQSWDWRRLLWFVAVFGPLSTAVDMGTFCLNWFYYNVRENNDPLISPAQTNWFVSGLITQVVIVHVLRTGKIPFVQSRASIGLLAVTAAVIAQGLVLAFALKAPNFMGTTPPDGVFVGVLVAQVAGYCALVQACKWVWKRALGGQWL
jgi:Mg2+-importing ATPase